MSIPPLFLGRLQFIACLAFVALFMALALALSWLLLYFKLRARASGNAGWTAAYRFWVRIFALAFVLALASGVPVLLQLGTVWSGLMDKIGNVAGPLLGFAVLSVFALKSCFLGVMLFGQRRVSEAVHTLSVLMVALGHLATAFWVLALVSWTQTPDGAVAIDGRFQIYDWAKVVFNPSLGWTIGATVLGALLTAAFLIMGITAWQGLRRPLDDGERLGFRAALGLACIAVVLLAPVGAGMGKLIAHYQPAKAAAALAYWHEGAAPDLVVLGWPDAETETNRAAWTLSGAAARWLGRNVNGHFLALENYANMQPPVLLTFWSARIVAILALAMACVAWATLFRLRKSGFDPSHLSRRWLRALALMTFSGAALVVFGWVFTMVGMQPYAVNGAVTQTEILGTASPRSLFYGTLGYAALYGVLFAAFVRMLFHAARYGVVPVRKMAGAAP
ncbi:cytochrome ubiquinol oxidase subunit I [Bordetella bronchialis]|uniref:Transmembrane cytochrome oxidase n=1 Tax=Bordetella bronchialis TaxID=463025 RepID=A0A193FEW1_9BORD|nr:cytochrome ubiquinol oxidase subunit I [Bordetella bronchialis]ANN65808.1 transmembrane cytochrome oxidase [Bordetella bronchialis]ANN70839.1 transmembrane cytochrome oxidase [Bordetella bronchialis]